MKRTDLAAYLRSRRERITPDMAGLPPGTRRRTPGLRREEVAQLAGVGVTWYTWLEQGRPINASIQVLEAVARTLQLDPAERLHLFRLAGHQDPVPVADSGRVTPEMRQILDQLSPMAACIITSRHDILAWNAAYAAIFPEIADSEPNSLWLIFTRDDLFTRLVNREEELARAAAIFRGSYSRHAHDPCWKEFAEKLVAASPEFARMWARQDVADPGHRDKVFVNDAVGELHFTTTNFSCDAATETRMIIYTPANEATRSGVVWLTAHTRESV
ncbi:helix-turn-helix transcriptional regulator [Nonomuraea sp. NPDC050394]|uniref:helix-turn-helix transcriptional regulator n=1 Tax=Nonomuraea sp. NPDC050394 TaxID=3364363 RepID=UPI0037B35DC9